jgi:hypothetical protein
LPEQPDQLRGQRYGEQSREHRKCKTAEFTQQGALEDHFVNPIGVRNVVGSRTEGAVCALTSTKQTGDNLCMLSEPKLDAI